MSVSNDGASIPEVVAADLDDTRWALDTASTLWSQGDRREALRWVRRAAEAAAEGEQDSRALELAKAGAELRAAGDLPRTLPPPPPGLSPEPPSAEAADPGEGDDQLVVTVVSTDGSLPARDATLLSHRAVRVAIDPTRRSDGHFSVRPLAAGEVAPQDRTVGLLVALKAGASPLPPED